MIPCCFKQKCGQTFCEIRAEKVNGGLWTAVFIFGVSNHSILPKITVAPFPWETVRSWLSVPTCKRGFQAFTLNQTETSCEPVCVCLPKLEKGDKFSPVRAVCLLFLAGALICLFGNTPNFCQFSNLPIILTMWVTTYHVLALFS